MIDRSLNYGRHHVRNFLIRSKPFQSVLDLGAGNGSDLLLASEINPSTNRIGKTALQRSGVLPNVISFTSLIPASRQDTGWLVSVAATFIRFPHLWPNH